MTRYIEKQPLGARIIHGCVALSCILLAITGLFVFIPSLTAWAGPGVVNVMRIMHRIFGVIFVAVPLIGAFVRPGLLRHTLKNLFTKWDKDDVEFTVKFLPYLFAPKKIHMPDQHETKSGQRFADGMLILAAIFIAISGFTLWLGEGRLSPFIMQAALLVHDVSFMVLAIFGLAHIYLGSGIFQPYRHSRRIMFGDGKVSESDALYHWGHWAREELKSGEHVSEE